MKRTLSISSYLAFKEIWRNRGRFLLVSLVIALITLLVLFIAALGEGLGNGNREYISNLDAELIVFQAKADSIISASRLGRERLAAVRRVDGVADAAMLGTANAALILPGDAEPLKGDTLTLRVTQGTQDEFYDLEVVGITDGQQYSLQPSIFVPFNTWDQVRPKSEAEVNVSTYVGNVILTRLEDPSQVETVRERINAQVDNVEAATKNEAIQALPGYSAQQSTLQTQGGFTLVIGILVIGGFFQIQILQKVPQIGVLKAIGTANPTVALAAVLQIVIITIIGVAIGGILTFLFSLTFPPTVPIVFNGTTSAVAIIALLLIGPIGGLVSIRYAVRIEPLKALGLS